MLFSIDTIHEGTKYRIKDKEKALVFQKLCISTDNTRKMISDNLGLRPITVSKIIKELLEDKLVLEGDLKERSSKGRPEIKLEPNYSRFSAISIYIVSREIKGVLVALNGETVETYSVFCPKESDNSTIIAGIGKLLDILIAGIPSKSQLIGIGTSLPGTVNTETGKWVSSSRWPGLNNISFTELVSGYGVPLLLSRSLDPELEFLLFTNREYRKGSTVLFHWGYGIGSAFASEGKVIKSNLGRFGEIGHWNVVQNSNKKCSCGSAGCLETEAALWAIISELKEVYPDIPEDEPDFLTFIQSREIGNLPVMKKAVEYVAVSLANLYKVFYPDRILLLGCFTEEALIYNELKRRLLDQIPDYARPSVDLKVVSGFQGAVSGSVYHLFRDALRPLLRTRGNV